MVGDRCLAHRRVFVVSFLSACVLSVVIIFPFLGQDFFPSVDSGEFKLHLRAPTGTRIEDVAALCDRVDTEIRRKIPSQEVASIIDNIGVPYSGINLSYSNSAPVGPEDADILVSLSKNHHPTAQYVQNLRLDLTHRFPGVTFYFLPADMVSQILNFGLPAPIDIQVVGNDLEGNRQFADNLLNQLKFIPGTADMRIQQPFNQPKLHIRVDRTKAQEIGFTQREVASEMLVSLSGSFQTSPTFWLDPKNGVSYSIATQTPQYRIESLQDLQNIPVTGLTNAPPQILANLAYVSRTSEMAVVSHYNVQQVLDIFGSVQGRDLGGVASDIKSIVDDAARNLPKGSKLLMRGQMQTMTEAFGQLFWGLLGAVVLIYLLIVVNFQSWLDPFIIITALPAALAGIVWMLFLTHTTLSVPALTGAICAWVSPPPTASSSSASRARMAQGLSAFDATLEAGFTRFRPVLMTALAMIIGMVPMSMGLGEGGEQNAPLGRAVIGGLLLATVATLLFVPVVFSFIHGRRENARAA